MTPTTHEPPVFPELAGTRRFTADEYRRLIDAGILGPDDKVERLDGYVLLKQDHVDPPPADGPFPEWRWLRRWSADEYHWMIRAGILAEGEAVELLDGYLVTKMSRGPAHDCAINLFRAAVSGLIPVGLLLRSQQAITLGGTEPEPDFAVVTGPPRTYAGRHPGAGEIRWLVEVADSSLAFDRGPKGELYARAGIPVYWVVNVADRQVEVYADPDPAAAPPAYAARTDYAPGDAVPLVLDGRAVGGVPVADLLP